MQFPLNADAARLLAGTEGHNPVNLKDPVQFVEFRAGFDEGVRFLNGRMDTSVFDVETHDTYVKAPRAIPVREYLPAAAAETPTIVLYFHGGGWNVGGLETLDAELRWFSHRLGFQFVSVDYRLAPEHPFPAGFDDCMAVLRHYRDTNPGVRLAVAGDSSGGGLAASVTMAAREEGITLVAQLLINPALDASQSGRSHDEFAEGYLLTRDGMEFNWSAYLAAGDSWTNPLASPSHALDLSGLPPAVVVTVGYDVLRDEGVEYVHRLRRAGVRCEHLHLPGMLHGFVVMTGQVPVAADAIEQLLYHFGELVSQTEEIA